MRVVLATSPHLKHSALLEADGRPTRELMYSFTPMGLLMLAGALVEAGRPAPILFDTNREIMYGRAALDNRFYSQLADAVIELDPDVVGFMTECDSYHHVLQIGREIRRRRPQCRVILGGPHASAVARATMDTWTCVDAIVCGEGERVFVELLAAYERGWAGPVKGAWTRDASNQGVWGGARPVLDDFALLPHPAYELYRPAPGEEVFLEVGRGCPFRCKFCSTAPFWQRRHRVKAPQRIAKEIEEVLALYGTTRFHFTHDLFTTDREWVRNVCRQLVSSSIAITWTCSARTDTVDLALLESMADAGCRAIYFGLESGSPRVLREIDKDIPISESLEVVRQCRQVGITPNVGLIVGFPCDDRRSIEDTFALFERSIEESAHPAHVFTFCPFAQSAMNGDAGTMSCSGHFVDLPLGEEIDLANRELIRSDPRLFGSYFRPTVYRGGEELQRLLAGADEFSPLVDSMPALALMCSRSMGGMFAVYTAWLEWIISRNRVIGRPAYCQGYGSRKDFVEFARAHIDPARFPHGASLAEVMAVGLNVVSGGAFPAPTSMESYKSFPPSTARANEIGLGSVVSGSSILATVSVEYDVSPLLSYPVDLGSLDEPTEGPLHLAWQHVGEGRVRLLQVEPFLQSVLRATADGPKSAGELLLQWIGQGPGSVREADFAVALKQLRDAAAACLVIKEG